MPTPPRSFMGAAILNFFFPGIGYWYLGYRKVLGIHPVLILILTWIVEAVIVGGINIYAFGDIPEGRSPGRFLFLLPLLISLFLAYDAYVKAKGQQGWIDAQR